MAKSRGLPVPGVVGEGVEQLQVLFVGACEAQGAWYKPATTCNQLPGFLADVVRPGWDNEREFPTRLCCEVSWLLEGEGGKVGLVS